MRRTASIAAALAVLASVGLARATEPPTVTLLLHVPSTGTSPVRTDVVTAGAEMYWHHLHETLGELVHGAQIDVQIRDDGSSPTIAAAACSEVPDAVMILGLFGTATIDVCSQVAEMAGVPYLAPGINADVIDNETSFAVSPTHAGQAPIIADYVVHVLGDDVDLYEPQVNELPGCPLVRILGIDPLMLCPEHEADGVRIGLVRPDEPYFDELETSMRAGLQARGTDLHNVYVAGAQSSARAQEIATEMMVDGVDVAVMATNPIMTLQVTRWAASRGYAPNVQLPAVTSGFNTVAGLACRQGEMDGASAYLPWPGGDAMDAGTFDANFAAARATFAPDYETEDLDVLGAAWGMMATAHAILDAAGPAPTAAAILSVLDGGHAHATGVYPDFSVSAADRIGAAAVHRVEVDCAMDPPQFVQKDAFVTGYPAA